MARYITGAVEKAKITIDILKQNGEIKKTVIKTFKLSASSI